MKGRDLGEGRRARGRRDVRRFLLASPRGLAHQVTKKKESAPTVGLSFLGVSTRYTGVAGHPPANPPAQQPFLILTKCFPFADNGDK